MVFKIILFCIGLFVFKIFWNFFKQKFDNISNLKFKESIVAIQGIILLGFLHFTWKEYSVYGLNYQVAFSSGFMIPFFIWGVIEEDKIWKIKKQEENRLKENEKIEIVEREERKRAEDLAREQKERDEREKVMQERRQRAAEKKVDDILGGF